MYKLKFNSISTACSQWSSLPLLYSWVCALPWRLLASRWDPPPDCMPTSFRPLWVLGPSRPWWLQSLPLASLTLCLALDHSQCSHLLMQLSTSYLRELLMVCMSISFQHRWSPSALLPNIVIHHRYPSSSPPQLYWRTFLNWSPSFSTMSCLVSWSPTATDVPLRPSTARRSPCPRREM